MTAEADREIVVAELAASMKTAPANIGIGVAESELAAIMKLTPQARVALIRLLQPEPSGEEVVIVPKEPTPEMLKAYSRGLTLLIESVPEAERSKRWKRRTIGNAKGYRISPDEKAKCRWKAMIDARPARQATGSGEG